MKHVSTETYVILSWYKYKTMKAEFNYNVKNANCDQL